MVIIGRHGKINIENKPCRSELKNARREHPEDIQKGSFPALRTSCTDSATCFIDSDLSRLRSTSTSLSGRNCFKSESTYLTSYVTSRTDSDWLTEGYGVGELQITSIDPPLSSYQCKDSSTTTQGQLDSELKPSLVSTSSLPQFSRNYSGSNVFKFGCKQWKFVLFYVIFSMCIICKGCYCFVCPGSPVNSGPWFLRINETTVGIISDSGQCLTMTGGVAKEICSSNSKVHVSGRAKKLRDSNYNTKFCGLPLYSVLSSSEKQLVMNGEKSECEQVLHTVENLDNELRDLYSSFLDIVERMDCRQTYSYSVKWNCSACREAYKRWLCAVYVTYYFDDQQDDVIKPCNDFCDHVTQRCPFFRPFGEGLIGEPGFICKDTNIHPTRSAAIYGKPGCCYKPCHIYDHTVTSDKYKPCFLNITSNCTALNHAELDNAVTSSASPSMYMTSSTPVTSFLSTPHRLLDSSPYLVILSVTITWLLQTETAHSCVDLT